MMITRVAKQDKVKKTTNKYSKNEKKGLEMS